MDEYIRYSRLTGKKYDVFDTVRILNMHQAMAYIGNNVLPVDIKITKNANDQPMLVFYFIKSDTVDVYKLWKNHQLEVLDENMWDRC